MDLCLYEGEKTTKMRKEYIKPLFLLHLLLFVYSLGGISSKLAGKQDFFSFKFCFFYGIVLLLLFLYAIFWQQILKKLPLVTAFANKAVTVIWGIVWGALFFGEEITIQKIIGALVIIAGVYFVVSSDKKEEDEKK